MGPFENRLRVEVYRFFVAHCRAPVPAELATTLDVSVAEVEAGLRALAEEHVVVVVPGSSYIWMANPFSGLATDFKVHAGGREWWANCIWDAFGVLTVLGSDGTIATHCPDCSQPLQVHVENGSVRPADYVVHIAVPAARWWDDIGYT